MGGTHKQSDIPVILSCHCPCCHSHWHRLQHHHRGHHCNHYHHRHPCVFHSNAKGAGENIVTASISCNELEEEKNRWNCFKTIIGHNSPAINLERKKMKTLQNQTWKNSPIDEIASKAELQKFLLLWWTWKENRWNLFKSVDKISCN